MVSKNKIGLLAGNGQFPLLLARAAEKAGCQVFVVAHEGETDLELERSAHDIIWVKIGQLSRTIDFFQGHGVENAIMAGGITKENLFVNFDPDEKAQAILARLTEFSDDVFLRALAGELEKDGIGIRPAVDLLPDLLAPAGVLTKRAPDPEEASDIDLGWRAAKEIGRLDIGQCVVVRKKTVLAVEAIDGTDATIRRGGGLGREKVVVVKTCKPTQDRRFDLPSVGLGTVELMAEVGASVLAIEAGRTLMFDRGEMIALADRAGICIVARQEEKNA